MPSCTTPRPCPLSIQHPSLVHYIDLLRETNFLIWVANTMLVAAIATGISLLLGTMLAYPLARMRFRGGALLAVAVAVTYLIPQTLLFVPMADLIGRMKLGNTLTAVMLTYPTLLVPFIAWLLMGYFKTVPKELEEQAMIDGASRWRAMTRIILPLCMPGFLSAGIFAFTLSQNEFLYALLFLSEVERAHGAHRRRGRADPRRRLLLGPAHGGRPPRFHPRRPHLLVLREVLRRGPHRRRREGVGPQEGPRPSQGAAATQARRPESGEAVDEISP